MIHGSLYNGLLSIMSCITHLLVSFQGVLAEDKGVFVDQKITESTACSSRTVLATHKPLHQEKKEQQEGENVMIRIQIMHHNTPENEGTAIT